MDEIKSSDQAIQSESEGSGEACGWQEGSTGILAGIFAAVCCTFPPLLAALGLTGLAGALSAMPFDYHLVLQWIALGLVLVAWIWFGWKWTRMDQDNRRSLWTILTGIILVLVALYVAKTWYAHVFLMG